MGQMIEALMRPSAERAPDAFELVMCLIAIAAFATWIGILKAEKRRRWDSRQHMRGYRWGE